MAQSAWELYNSLDPQTQKYYIKKGAFTNAPAGQASNLTGQSGDWAMGQINNVLQAKGASPVYDPSQVASATAPLIAQRNKRGLSGPLGTILPIALSLAAPGIGSALGLAAGSLGSIGLGAGLGAIGGGITGGNIKSALTGGILGGAGSALSGGLGEIAKVGKVGGGTAGSGILGAASRQGGTLADVARGVQNFSTGTSNTLGSVLGNSPKAASMAAPAAGAVGEAAATSGGMDTMGTLGNILSGYQQYTTAQDQEDELMNAQRQAQAAYAPYAASGYQANRQLSDALSAGFDPGDLESDPGYQFRLQQGQKSLESGLAARGLGQSGAALKAAQEYGQGFANQEYTDAYNRWLANNQQLAQQSGQGVGVAGSQADIYGNMGNIGATATAAKNNAVTGTLSGILSGRGITGWDAQGNPIYG